MMQDMLVQVEPLIPALRRYARALVRNRAIPQTGQAALE